MKADCESNGSLRSLRSITNETFELILYRSVCIEARESIRASSQKIGRLVPIDVSVASKLHHT